MRGKRRRCQTRRNPKRITPADAGKTYALKEIKQSGEDHPRGCGENYTRATNSDGLPGSPPRMRGKPNRIVELADSGRITPADAGKTGCSCPEGLQSGDHPRGCGENRSVVWIWKPVVGSPPRMRGKPPQSRFLLPCCGITPADAGKT